MFVEFNIRGRGKVRDQMSVCLREYNVRKMSTTFIGLSVVEISHLITHRERVFHEYLREISTSVGEFH